MPYIKQEKRRTLDLIHQRLELMGFDVTGGLEIGDINYIITNILRLYISIKGKKYSTCNDLVGVLDCAKMELYRRIIAPYEDEKIKENGDVY